MRDNIQTNTTGRLTPCLQQKIDKTRYLVEVHFSDTSTQSVEDRLKRVILHDLEHGKQGKSRKSDEKWWVCPWQVAAGKTAKSILISCGARRAPFDIAELREITRYDELDTLGDRKTALFLIMSDTDSTLQLPHQHDIQPAFLYYLVLMKPFYNTFFCDLSIYDCRNNNR